MKQIAENSRLFHLKTDMIARFCGVQRKYSRLRKITTTAMAYRAESVVARIPKWGHMWHETNKKSRYGGDVRAGALSWV